MRHILVKMSSLLHKNIILMKIRKGQRNRFGEKNSENSKKKPDILKKSKKRQIKLWRHCTIFWILKVGIPASTSFVFCWKNYKSKHKKKKIKTGPYSQVSVTELNFLNLIKYYMTSQSFSEFQTSFFYIKILKFFTIAFNIFLMF